MSLENRPMGGEFESQPKREWIRKPGMLANKWRAAMLFAMTLVPQFAQEAKSDSDLGKLATIVFTKIAKDKAESHESEKIQNQALQATIEANSETDLSLIPQDEPRFVVQGIQVNEGNNSRRRWRGWNSREQGLIESRIRKMLTDVFGGKIAPTMNQVDTESGNRDRVQNNRWVKPSTKSGEETIMLGNVSVSGEFGVYHDQKDLVVGIRSVAGFTKYKGIDLEMLKDTTTAVGGLTIANIESQQAIEVTTVGVGGVSISGSASAGSRFSGGHIATRENKESMELSALQKAIDNLEVALKEKLKKDQAKMRPDNRVQHTGDSENGIDTGESKE